MDTKTEDFTTIISSFIESTEETRLIDLDLDKDQRAVLHKLAEDAGISSYSIGGSVRKLILSRSNVNLDSPQSIILYSKFSSTPIPTTVRSLFDYYLDTLNPYYKARESYAQFTNAVIKVGSVSKLEKMLFELVDRIVADLNAEKNNLKFDFGTLPAVSGSVYQSMYTDKTLISVDIRSANFTVLKLNNVLRFNDAVSWIEFLRRYTDIPFILNSKYFREIVFGKLGVGKLVANLGLKYIGGVITFLKEIGIDESDIAAVNHDEVVFETPFFDDVVCSDIEKKFGGQVKAQAFDLKRLGTTNFYVKEYFDGRREFKQVGKSFICQAIKKYRKEPINESDLTFIHEGYTAVYKQTVFEPIVIAKN